MHFVCGLDSKLAKRSTFAHSSQPFFSIGSRVVDSTVGLGARSLACSPVGAMGLFSNRKPTPRSDPSAPEIQTTIIEGDENGGAAAAAAKIQAVKRGKKARFDVEKQSDAATKIASIGRGMSVRRKSAAARSNEMPAHPAALKRGSGLLGSRRVSFSSSQGLAQVIGTSAGPPPNELLESLTGALEACTEALEACTAACTAQLTEIRSRLISSTPPDASAEDAVDESGAEVEEPGRFQEPRYSPEMHKKIDLSPHMLKAVRVCPRPIVSMPPRPRDLPRCKLRVRTQHWRPSLSSPTC